MQSFFPNTSGFFGETQSDTPSSTDLQPIKRSHTLMNDTRFGKEQNAKAIAKKNISIQQSNHLEK